MDINVLAFVLVGLITLAALAVIMLVVFDMLGWLPWRKK